jgi:flagellar hook-associated protein 2
MGIAPLVFTGISQFSDDFQTILDRTVAIASLPIQDMQNQQADLLIKKQILSDIGGVVSTLGSSLQNLGEFGGTRALGASSSNTSRVSVTLTGATEPGSYTITEIDSIAAAASETSASGFATSDSTAVSSDGTMELVVGTDTYVIDLTGDYDNSLEGVRDAINDLGAGVSANILNTGTGADPYYLSITGLETGATTLELRETAGETGTNILTADNQGSDAVFKLNGLTVTKSENTINDVIPGLSFNINSVTGLNESVSITLSSSRGNVVSEIESMVEAYNTVRGYLSLQIGENAGLLSGDYIVREIQNSLRHVASYQGAGDIANLADLGITFDQAGTMSFDSAAVYSMSDTDFEASLDYFGNATEGFGALAARFDQITAPVTGLISTQQNQYDVTDARLTDQIESLAERIDYMQRTTSLKLQQADVLLAQLESQQTMIEASLEGLNLVSFGRNE